MVSALAFGDTTSVDKGAPATTAPPTTVPPPATTVPAGAPCDQTLIKAAVAAGTAPGQDFTVRNVICAGSWADAFGAIGRDDFTWLLHWNGAAWEEPSDRSAVCSSGAVPTTNNIWQFACNSG